MSLIGGFVVAAEVIFFTILVIIIVLMTCIFWFCFLVGDEEKISRLNTLSAYDHEEALTPQTIKPCKEMEIAKFERETEGLITANPSCDSLLCQALIRHRDAAENIFLNPISEPEKAYIRSQLTNFRKTLVLQAMIESSLNPNDGLVTCVKDAHSCGKITVGSIVVVRRQFINLCNLIESLVGDLLQVLRFYVKKDVDDMEAYDEVVDGSRPDLEIWCTAIVLKAQMLHGDNRVMRIQFRKFSSSSNGLLTNLPVRFISNEIKT